MPVGGVNNPLLVSYEIFQRIAGSFHCGIYTVKTTSHTAVNTRARSSTMHFRKSWSERAVAEYRSSYGWARNDVKGGIDIPVSDLFLDQRPLDFSTICFEMHVLECCSIYAAIAGLLNDR